jgi:hypothetical protein
MKLKQGYTLSQLVDIIKLETTGEYSGVDFVNILLYNDLLKQPLKPEQFVNDFKWKSKDEFTGEELKQWQEAEKKVIFDCDFKILDSNGEYGVIINKLFFPFGTTVFTLGHVFEATKGQLKTKNLEI